MVNAHTKPNKIDEYIAAFPEDVQAKLQALRTIIQEAASEAQEAIS